MHRASFSVQSSVYYRPWPCKKNARFNTFAMLKLKLSNPMRIKRSQAQGLYVRIWTSYELWVKLNGNCCPQRSMCCVWEKCLAECDALSANHVACFAYPWRATKFRYSKLIIMKLQNYLTVRRWSLLHCLIKHCLHCLKPYTNKLKQTEHHLKTQFN